MKFTSILCLIFIMSVDTQAAMIWSQSSGVDAPESVYYDPQSKVLFVSNIIGGGTDKDGKGRIQKFSVSGELIDNNWVKGLNAPKGMRSQNGVLWVTDIDTLVSVDIKSGKILNRVVQPKAKFLNDIAISSKGRIFVSDTLGRTIYELKNNQLQVFAQGDNTEGPNGLLFKGDQLVVAAWGLSGDDWATKVSGRLYTLNLNTKKKTLITQKPLGNLDGLELSSEGNYLVSDWVSGKIFSVSPDGKKIKLLHQGTKGLADIGHISESKTVVFPNMLESKIEAHLLGE